MEVRERFLSAIEFVEEHLDEPLRLDQVAAHARLSPFYFSRLFRVLTGETFAGYLRRRRLTLAARALCEADVPLVELAFACGYDSQEAFTRAFKRAFGRTPGAYRARPPRHRMDWCERIDARVLEHLTEVLDMKPEIRTIEAFTVVGVRGRFDPDDKHQIPALWQRFLALERDVPARLGADSFGVCLNGDPETGSFDYIAGVAVERVETLPPGLIAELLPRQTCAVFRHTLRSRNLHAELQPTLRWIWGTWLPGNPDWEHVEGPDYEHYPPEFDPSRGEGWLDLCVPVRARA